MQIVNFAPITIHAAAPAGETLVTAAQANAALAAGADYVAINPSVAIVLVDASGGQNWGNIPNAIAGSAANSPFSCAANTVTMVAHGGGEIKAITTGADSVVKWAFAVDQ